MKQNTCRQKQGGDAGAQPTALRDVGAAGGAGGSAATQPVANLSPNFIIRRQISTSKRNVQMLSVEIKAGEFWKAISVVGK